METVFIPFHDMWGAKINLYRDQNRGIGNCKYWLLSPIYVSQIGDIRSSKNV